MGKELKELKESYYEYVSKISEGCQVIANKLRDDELDVAFTSIANFSEGLSWLLQVEETLLKEGYSINSRTSEVLPFIDEINEAIETQDFTLIADLFEYEIMPIFSSAVEWQFSGKE